MHFISTLRQFKSSREYSSHSILKTPVFIQSGQVFSSSRSVVLARAHATKTVFSTETNHGQMVENGHLWNIAHLCLGHFVLLLHARSVKLVSPKKDPDFFFLQKTKTIPHTVYFQLNPKDLHIYISWSCPICMECQILFFFFNLLLILFSGHVSFTKETNYHHKLEVPGGIKGAFLGHSHAWLSIIHQSVKP